MPYVIGEPCISTKDASCVAVCPVDCIHDAGEMMVIDPGECIDCGACLAECPVEAIFVDDEAAPGQQPWIAVNAAWPDGPEAVARLIAVQRR